MQELEVTGKRILSVWWLLVWRGMLGGAVLGGIAGFIWGVIAGVLGVASDVIANTAGIGGGMVGLIWGFFVTGMALRKKYGEFRVVLVSHSSN